MVVVSISGGGALSNESTEGGHGCFYLSCYENLVVLKIIMYHTDLSKPTVAAGQTNVKLVFIQTLVPFRALCVFHTFAATVDRFMLGTEW